MSFNGDSGKSRIVRFRGLFGHRSRALCVGVFLLGGALSGMPISPEEIEEHMRSMSTARIVQVCEVEQRHPSDIPGEDEMGGAAVGRRR